MHALVEMLIGLVAMLAAAALAQFGVEAGGPRHNDSEIHRVSDCGQANSSKTLAAAPNNRDC